MLKIKSIVHGTCIDLSSEGKGVVKIDEDTIFCDGLFIDEEADIRIEYKRSQVYYGKVVKLYSLSKYRIQPLCKVCTSCGGCQFQQLSYEGQLFFKKNRVLQAFKRIGHQKSLQINDIIGMDEPYYYRNKIQVPVGYDKHHNIVYGMYKSKSHELIPIDTCNIQDVRCKEILDNVIFLINKYDIKPYNEIDNTGIIRHIMIRTSKYYDEIMLVLVVTTKNYKNKDKFIENIIKNCQKVTTIVENINNKVTNVILGDKENILYGKGYIKDNILGLDFKISAESFFQINSKQVGKLYKSAIDLLNLTENDVLLDAYSGVGTIGLLASKYCKKVYSVEINKKATIDGQENAKINNIYNVEFINDDAGRFIKNLKEDINALIMDPPRKGSSKEFLDEILNKQISKIAYISCNPETLARDVLYLCKEYDIVSVTPFDMFPMTSHVESVCILIKK